jgi:hypothetical protein
MSGEEKKTHPALTGVLAALTQPEEDLAAAATDPVKLYHLCGMVEDDGPDAEREDAILTLAGLLSAQSLLRGQLGSMIEDARALAPYGPRKGVTVNECRWIRGLVLGFINAFDSATATAIAAAREIHWPDTEVWPDGLPASPGVALATVLSGIDERRVAALGLSWLDAEIIPPSLEPAMRPVLEIFLDLGAETVRQFEDQL